MSCQRDVSVSPPKLLYPVASKTLQCIKETIMHERSLVSMITVAIAGVTVSAGISVSITRTQAQVQAQVASATAPPPTLTTPWGEPDLQGIWTDEFETPLQRPAKYADQEFFTESERAGLDIQRSALPGKDKRAERGTEFD